MPSTEFIAIGTPILMLLLSGNVYFIKRLVDRVDGSPTKEQWEVLSNKLAEIKQDIKDLRRIEIEVAVLRSQITKQREEDKV